MMGNTDRAAWEAEVRLARQQERILAPHNVDLPLQVRAVIAADGELAWLRETKAQLLETMGLMAGLLKQAADDIDKMFPKDPHTEMQGDLRQVAEIARELATAEK